MKPINKIVIAFVFVLSFGLHGCYEEYAKDFDYSAVYFGEQKPLRTLVTRTDQPELVFKIGATIGGLRENTKGYDVEYELAPDLLATVDGANKFKLLPSSCYTIENDNNFTFHIPEGKIIGDCQVRINKNAFVALQGSLEAAYVIPLRLLSTTADTILADKNYTIIAVKYIDEHSGNYYCKGWRAEWNGTDTINTVSYSRVDLSANKIRSLTTMSLTRFDMPGITEDLGYNDAYPAAVDHLIINMNQGEVTLETQKGCSPVVFRSASYNADAKTFILDYLYTREGKQYLINEELVLRQDVEKELRFENW